MKWNILRHLRSQGCRVTVLPGTVSAEEILERKPDGIFLSNGPGDPEPLDYASKSIGGVLGKVPVFGFLKRGDKVYMKVIDDTSSVTLCPIIECKVVQDSIVYSDC